METQGMGVEIPAEYGAGTESLAETKRTAPRSKTGACIVAVLLAAFYFFTSIHIASNRLFWFDEIVTIRIAGLADLAAIRNALAHGADGTPLGYYLLAKTLQNVSGSSQGSLRLLSAVAMVLGMLITFDCARRLSDGLHGLIALAVLTCSFLPYYGYEARSYAIYFLLAALSLWIWICAPNDRWWSALLFGVVLFLAVTIHYYAVLLLVPYALWEGLRWKPRQMPSGKLAAGLLGVALAALLQSKLILSYSHQFSAGFSVTPFMPSFDGLRAVFNDLFPEGLFLLVLMTVGIVLTLARNGNTVREPMQAGESVAWLFLCMPLAGFVLAEWKTHAFLSRYFIGAVAGVAVAFSCGLWRHFRNRSRLSLGVFLLLAGWGVAHQLGAALHPERIEPAWGVVQATRVDLGGHQAKIRHYRDLEAVLRSEGKRFFVFTSSTLHYEMAYYSQHPEECVLLLPSDPTHMNIQNFMELKLLPYDPLPVWNLDDLAMHASEAALIEPRSDILDELIRAGLKVSLRFPQPREVLFVQH